MLFLLGLISHHLYMNHEMLMLILELIKCQKLREKIFPTRALMLLREAKSMLMKLNRWLGFFKLSDRCSITMHMMMKTFLPHQNRFPPGYQYVCQMKKKSFSEKVPVVRNSPRQSLYITSFGYQLRDIVQQNISEIFDYSKYRKK